VIAAGTGMAVIATQEDVRDPAGARRHATLPTAS